VLDSETKRRIDSARDILVGKVPDPKSQVEQITIALIYKFMDDMDAGSEELGGERKFFAGEFAKYGWSKLMRQGVGGHEMLGLYGEAIQRMPENPGIPPLFRNIFNNAYLPYRDPETLRAFLKVIDEFEYDHSERLGDAFEYLLSVLGSQGDAGQFRTPRHIIEFMVDIVDPKKNEKVLDPACETGGFLISAWKHILEANTDANGQSTLTPDERAALANNFIGYDISPDMVRLSLVNMYLHGFANPEIVEYDTLTSDEKWNEHADVILANPPFMSPKGGIRPHNRFGVQSKRSEVLFVDYMAEHLTSNGRAGIIVPEGIIFQSGSAYRKLRELLVKSFLVGVISLPSGVFMPYSGVKTSILIFDRVQAKRNPSILFSEVKHIGVTLGVKRTATELNDLPAILGDYQAYYQGGEYSQNSWAASREEVAANDFILTGIRYRPETFRADQQFVRIGDVCTITKGRFSSTKTPPGPYPLILTAADAKTSSEYQLEGPAVCVPLISSLGHGKAALHRIHFVEGKFALANLLVALAPRNANQLNARFLFYVLDSRRQFIAGLMRGAANVGMKPEDLEQFQIPLPSLEEQEEIVMEIEGYQKVIDGARAVVENYRPHIVIDPEWPVVELGSVCERIMDGTHFSPNNYADGDYLYLTSKNVREGFLDLKNVTFVSHKDHETIYSRCPVRPGDVLYIKDGANTGFAAINTVQDEISLLSSVAVIRGRDSVLDNQYLTYFLNTRFGRVRLLSMVAGVAITRLTLAKLNSALIPLPPFDTQLAIVSEIDGERELVRASQLLIQKFETKIAMTLSRIWGESE
jgi:type I restriction enzyme M protein